MYKTIGIIGYGNMGSAIAERIRSKYPIWVFDKDGNKTKNLSSINIAENVVALLNRVDTVVLAVKPQDFDSVLNEIKDNVDGKLIISIAAGITTKYIENRLCKVRVIRVMPNLPAGIGEGMICLSKGKTATEEDLNFIKQLFKVLGKTLILNEDMMNAATAVSGSGPAYVCEYLESGQKKELFFDNFQKAARAIGFNEEDAKLLAETTFTGTLEFLKKTKVSPSQLKKQVASKGGTTEAALEVLHKGGSLEEAVKAAEKRAEGLSRKE